jgi:hypothetical protein
MLNGARTSPDSPASLLGCHTAERLTPHAINMAPPSPTWSPNVPQPSSPTTGPAVPSEITWTLRQHPSSPGPSKQLSPPRQCPREGPKHDQPSPAASLDAASWLHWPETLAHQGGASPQQKPLTVLGPPPELMWQSDGGKLARVPPGQGHEAGSRDFADWTIPALQPHGTAPGGMMSPPRDPGWALSWQVRDTMLGVFLHDVGKPGQKWEGIGPADL